MFVVGGLWPTWAFIYVVRSRSMLELLSAYTLLHMYSRCIATLFGMGTRTILCLCVYGMHIQESKIPARTAHEKSR